jgi:hypothetical protein
MNVLRVVRSLDGSRGFILDWIGAQPMYEKARPVPLRVHTASSYAAGETRCVHADVENFR